MSKRLDDPDFELDGDFNKSEGAEEVEEPEEVEDQQESDKGIEPEPSESDDGEEIPDEYFGFRLSDIEDPEAKKATYDSLRQANRVANRRLQEIAELRKTAEEEARKTVPQPSQQAASEEETNFSDMTDEEILAQAGLDPDILQYEDFGKPVAEMVRRQLRLEQKLEGQTNASEAEAWERKFYTQLDTLQETHGNLPFDRETVEAYAIERNVFDPDALYWSIMGPVLREAATNKGPDPRQELKRKVGGQPKRRSSTQGATSTQKPKTLAEALAQAKEASNVPDSLDPFAYEE